jgi:hypothetical protein
MEFDEQPITMIDKMSDDCVYYHLSLEHPQAFEKTSSLVVLNYKPYSLMKSNK